MFYPLEQGVHRMTLGSLAFPATHPRTMKIHLHSISDMTLKETSQPQSHESPEPRVTLSDGFPSLFMSCPFFGTLMELTPGSCALAFSGKQPAHSTLDFYLAVFISFQNSPAWTVTICILVNPVILPLRFPNVTGWPQIPAFPHSVSSAWKAVSSLIFWIFL